MSLRGIFAVTFVTAAMIVSYVYFFSLEEVEAKQFTREDGFVESLAAVAFLASAGFFLVAFFRSCNRPGRFLFLPTAGNWYFLVFAAAFFLCFGEEISWGQRIFGWNTPAGFAAVNVQQETNLHNLSVLRYNDAVDPSKSYVFHLDKLVWLAFFFYFIVVPWLDFLLAWPKAFFRNVGIPIPPRFFGAILLAAYLPTKFVPAAGLADRRGLAELQETNYAICILCLSIIFAVAAHRK